MKLYKNYIILILLLAVILNWVVAGNNIMEKGNMNLGLLPKFSIIIIEFLQVLITFRICILYNKNNFVMAALVAVAAFCILELVVIIAMGADILIWVSGIRYYFSFFPLFILCYLLAFNGHSIKREMNWLIILILFQIPVAVYQFFNTSKVHLVRKGQPLFDMISGTMGGNASNLMSLVIGIAFLYFLIKLIETKKIIYLLIVVALLVPPILAEAKGMLILIGISLIYLAFIFKFNFVRILVLGVIAAFMLIGFSYAYSSLGYGYGKKISVSYLVDYASGESGKGRLSRVDSIIHSFKILSENDALLLGVGIGNSNKSPLGQDGQFYDFFTIRHSLDILIAETGLMGLFFLCAIFGYMIRISKNLLRDKTITGNKDNLLTLRVFFGSIFVLLYGLGWVDVLFRVQFMYPFGMMAGYTIGLYHKIKSEEKQKPLTFSNNRETLTRQGAMA